MLKTLRHVRNIWQSCRKFSTAAAPPVTFSPISPQKQSSTTEVLDLLEKYKDTILFSSYQHDNSLSWKEQQIVDRYDRKRSEAQTRDSVRVKPFSLAAQLLEGNHYLPTAASDESQVNENKIESVKVNTIALDDNRPSNSMWMHDYESYDDSEDDPDLGVYGTPGRTDNCI